MSWGERSCKRPCRALKEDCTMEKCNVNCYGYEWDGVTEPDSAKTVSSRVTNTSTGLNRAQRRALAKTKRR